MLLLLQVAAVVQATTITRTEENKQQQAHRLNKIINGQHTKMQSSQGKQEPHRTYRSNMSCPGATALWSPEMEDGRGGCRSWLAGK